MSLALGNVARGSSLLNNLSVSRFDDAKLLIISIFKADLVISAGIADFLSIRKLGIDIYSTCHQSVTRDTPYCYDCRYKYFTKAMWRLIDEVRLQ